MIKFKKDFPWLSSLRRSRRTPTLGKRELAVLEILWQSELLTAQQIHDRMSATGIGLNTVQSTLERLFRKSLIAREKSGRAYCYSPSISREEIISSLLSDIELDIAGGDMRTMISGFKAYIRDQQKPDDDMSREGH
jgi:predicted transcriptional regulator